MSGLQFHPTEAGLLYARTDVGGAYRYDTANAAGFRSTTSSAASRTPSWTWASPPSPSPPRTRTASISPAANMSPRGRPRRLSCAPPIAAPPGCARRCPSSSKAIPMDGPTRCHRDQRRRHPLRLEPNRPRPPPLTNAGASRSPATGSVPARSHAPVADPVEPLRFYIYDSKTGIGSTAENATRVKETINKSDSQRWGLNTPHLLAAQPTLSK